MRLGLVSNVWNVQLARDEDLGDLVGAAAQRGYRVIELRQKSLGRYESPDTALPDVSALGALAAEFPSLHFVAAYEVPFLDPGTTPDERYFAAAMAVARAVANGRRPHVRLVDLRTSAEQLAGWGAVPAGRTIARLATTGRHPLGRELPAAVAAAGGGHRQPRGELGAGAERLRVCFDPCNFAASADPTDSAAVLAAFSPKFQSLMFSKFLGLI